MARTVCEKCHRPEKVCFCSFIKPIDNVFEVGIFQHPTETKQIKGTALLTHRCLQNSRLWVGEKITDVPELIAWLDDDIPVYLLYPPTEGIETSVLCSAQELQTLQSPETRQNFKILVLDGTWRKTFKMMQLNPQLQALNRVSIEPKNSSTYIIRKQKDAQSLSTIEAVVTLMAELESNRIKFQPALDAFAQMQAQQMAFREAKR